MIRATLRNYKNLIEVFIFLLINLLIRRKRPILQPNTLLIVRLDGIGDYILFRNFIEIIKKSERFKNYKITLCGNVAWREIAEKLDGEYIDSYIWIDIPYFTNFFRGFLYRFSIARKLQKTNYEVVFSPTYSRSFATNDVVVSALFAERTVGVAGDFSNITSLQHRVSKRFYSELIYVDKAFNFEFYTNKQIIEIFLGTLININKPTVTITEEIRSCAPIIVKPFAAIFLGSSQAKRKWPAKKFLEIAKLINSRFQLKIAILGSAEDSFGSQLIVDNMSKGEAIDFAGKAGLVDLISIIANASLLISNDTCAIHFAAAVNTPVIVISSGLHYGRFHPYPSQMHIKNLAVYPTGFSCDYQLMLTKRNAAHRVYNVDDVYVADVAAAVSELLG